MADEKSSVHFHWLSRYNVRSTTLVLIATFWGLIGLLLYHSSWGDQLEAKLAAPIDFHIREAFQKTPSQDHRLKIFAMDDQTFAFLGSPNIDLKLWGDLLDGFAESKPQLIVIDAMLSAKPTESSEQLAFYFSRLRELNVPVVLGAFTHRQDLEFKTPLDMSAPWYKVEHYLPSKDTPTDGRGLLSHVPAWTDRSTWHVYGPAAELKPWFAKIGHFQLFEDHKIEPFLKIGENQLLPHVTMFGAKDLKFVNGNLLVDDVKVALDRKGAIDVNFLPQERWKVRSLVGPIKDVREGYTPSGVTAGDIVLILPLYFTGNTDFRSSPFGLMPGGLYLASMLNSVLNHNWLQPILATEVFLFIGLATLVVALIHVNTAGFWLFSCGLVLGLFTCAQVLFSLFGFVIPWCVPSLTFMAYAVHGFALKMRFHERKVLMLKSALEGAVDPVQLEQVLRRPEDVNLDARERVVTLMFIDVVGFSLAAENMLPRLAFDTLKEILNEIGAVVHEYGGVVDKTLGDGLLCYFGYRFDTDSTSSDHAEKALRCAIRIQELNLARNQQALESGEPLYPLRIGINTASSYLGDLGSGHRIEFTVVGNGVNFAKRLEGACEMFSVMMGITTWELVKGVDLQRGAVSRKLIRIKHHKELIDAFEFDSLFDRPELRTQILEAFRRFANLLRLNERIPVNDASALVLTCDHGRGNVVNFSGTGISLQFKTPLSRGSLVKFTLDSPDQKLQPALAERGIREIEAEVRWNYQSVNGFVHGLMFKNISEEQSEEFMRIVGEYAFSGDGTREGVRHEAS